MPSAFRALLEDLHARDLAIVKEPHITAIMIVRAGILRSAIGAVMACLDPEDRRGNRASVGQDSAMLQDATPLAVFPERDGARQSAAEALQRARGEYAALVKSDLFDRGWRLRNDMILIYSFRAVQPRRCHIKISMALVMLPSGSQPIFTSHAIAGRRNF